MKNVIKKPIFWIVCFIVIISIGVIVYLFRSGNNVFSATHPSGSMENTIMTGDKISGDRGAYEYADPQRGDVIAFKYPDNEKESFVKRIIGLPGEKVTIKDSKIYINDSKEPLKEDYLKEEWTEGNDFDEPFEVPRGSYFCLGDNRNVSNDARYWENKYVKKSKIVAKIENVIWPKEHKKKIETPKY